MQRFKSPRSAHRFLPIHAIVPSIFKVQRHPISSPRSTSFETKRFGRGELLAHMAAVGFAPSGTVLAEDVRELQN